MLAACLALAAELQADPAGLCAIALAAGLLWPLAPARWRTGAQLPVAIAIIATLAVAALAWASGPIKDDYHHAWQGRDGWLAYQGWMWQHWAGRYTATAILSAWPLGGGLVTWYPAMVLLVDAIALVGILALLARLLPAAWPPAERRAAIAWLWLALLAGWPTWSEGVSWVSGSVTYTLPVGLACGGFALLLAPPGGSVLPRILGIVLAVLACGAAETATVLVAGGAVLAAAIAWRRRDPRRAWLLAAAIAVCAASALAAGAPGNHARHGTLADRPQELTTAEAAGQTRTAALAMLEVCASPSVLAPLLLVAGIAWRQGAGLARSGAVLLACAVAAPLTAFALCAIPAWGAGWIAPRILTNVWFALWALAACAACAAAAALPARLVTAMAGILATRRRHCAALCLAAAALALPAVVAGWLHLGVVAAVLVLAAGLALPRLPPGPWLAGTAAALVLLGGALWQVLADLPRLPGQRAAVLHRDALCRAAAPGSTIRIPPFDPRTYARTCVMFDIDLATSGNEDMRRWYGLGGLGADITPWREAGR